MHLPVIVLCFLVSYIKSTEELPQKETAVKTNQAHGTIEHYTVQNPNDLTIGKCPLGDKLLHQENVILYNDGRSQVAAGIRMTVEGDVKISCVKIYDEMRNDTRGGVPKHSAGGPEYNYVEFTVTPTYGRGFHFFVQIYGHSVDSEAK